MGWQSTRVVWRTVWSVPYEKGFVLNRLPTKRTTLTLRTGFQSFSRACGRLHQRPAQNVALHNQILRQWWLWSSTCCIVLFFKDRHTIFILRKLLFVLQYKIMLHECCVAQERVDDLRLQILTIGSIMPNVPRTRISKKRQHFLSGMN